MDRIERLLLAIDRMSEWTAKFARWTAVILMAVMCFEVVARYVFGHPTMWASALAPMLGATMITLGWSYVHQQRANVRVDFLYLKMSERGKAVIDVAGDVLVLLPLLITLVYSSFRAAIYSWAIGEVMIQTSWYAPAGPIKSIVLVGVVLLAIQGFSNFCNSLSVLLRRHQT